MPRTHRQIAKEAGTTLDVIKKLSASGVNIYDKNEREKAIKNTRHRVNPDTKLSEPDNSKRGPVSLAEYKDRLAVDGITLDEIKTLKEAGLAHKALTAAQKEEGLVISILEVEERETRIGAATKAAFDKMGNDLPGACSGLDEVGVLKVYEGLKLEVLTMLADLKSEFWKERKL